MLLQRVHQPLIGDGDSPRRPSTGGFPRCLLPGLSNVVGQEIQGSSKQGAPDLTAEGSMTRLPRSSKVRW